MADLLRTFSCDFQSPFKQCNFLNVVYRDVIHLYCTKQHLSNRIAHVVLINCEKRKEYCPLCGQTADDIVITQSCPTLS